MSQSSARYSINMSLEKYWKSYLEFCSVKNGANSIPEEMKGIPIVVAPLIAAGHEVNMPVDELSRFINKFREIDDVTRRLTIRELELDKIEKVTEAFQAGSTYSKDVIPKIFQKDEVAKQYHEIIFPESNG